MLAILLLSFIQGLTEFLPVSSSGHLILWPHFLGFEHHSLEIDGVVHFGTLLAVVFYFFQDLKAMTQAFFFSAITFIKNRARNPSQIMMEPKKHSLNLGYDPLKLSLCLIISTLPVIILGLFLKRFGLNSVRVPAVIGVASIIGGIFLYGADIYGRHIQKNHDLSHMTYSKALMMGFFQCLSLVPGSSRSGMCMVGARVLGFSRYHSARYSFLMAIPAILGAFTLIMVDSLKVGFETPLVDLGLYGAFSLFFGLFAIHFMLQFIQKYSFFVFMVYRVVLGVVVLLFF